MSLATLTARGQVTIPKAIRERFSLQAGDQIDFQIDDGIAIRMIPKTLTPAEVCGSLADKPRKKQRLTLEEMNEVIRQAIKRKRA